MKRKLITLHVMLLILLVTNTSLMAQTVSLTATSATTTGTYFTLKAAFDAINAGTHQGVIGISINSNITESATASINASGSGSASYASISVQPSGGAARTITGNLNSALVLLNGADNVTIDGLNSGSNSLTIENPNTGNLAETVSFDNDATYNTITNCTIKGSTTVNTCGAYSGGVYGMYTYSSGWYSKAVISFLNTASSSGNSNNTISNNIIGASGSNLPWCLILSYGNASYANSSNTISNNSLSDNYSDYDAKAFHSYDAAILLQAYNTAWTISGNSIFQTGTRDKSYDQTTRGHITPIKIQSGQGYTISANYIGGSSANCGGTAMTYTGKGFNFTVIDMYINQGGLTSTNTISGNTIQNISYTTGCTTNNSNQSNGRFRFIYFRNGKFTINNNTFGKDGVNGSVTISKTSAGYSNYQFICHYSSGTNGCTLNSLNGNVFSGIRIDDTYFDFYGIYFRSDATYNYVGEINGNTFGSTSRANSIDIAYSTSSVTRSFSFFVYLTYYNTSTATTCDNNVFQNISKNDTENDALSLIYTASTDMSIQGNNISKINGGGASQVYVIRSSGSNPTIAKNLISRISGSSSIYALYNSNSSNGGTIKNNVISLGYDNDGNSLPNLEFNGIYSNYGGSYYFNTVCLLGIGSSGTQSSYAFANYNTTGTKNIRNNIFSNDRTNSGGSGTHYAIRLAGTSSLTIDYNNYYASGTGGVLGYLSSDKSTLASWKSATSSDVNSLNTDPACINPGGISVDDYLPTANLTGVSGTGVTTDYHGSTRSSTPYMGALEGFVWKGGSSSDFATSGNWNGGSVPSSGASIFFDASPSNHCLLDGDRTVGNIINAQSTYDLVVNGNTLTIQGALDLTNSAEIDASTSGSIIKFGGSSAQTIPADAFASDAIKYLTIDNASGVSLNGDLTIDNNLVVNSGKVLTIAPGKTLTVTGTTTNSAGNSGIVIESDATGTGSLITTSNVGGTVENFQTYNKYHYYSSPIASSSYPFSSNFNNSYFWNEATQEWNRQFNSLTTGRGYGTFPITNDQTLSVAGTMNTGTITVSVACTDKNSSTTRDAEEGWELVGNPYPCGLGISSFTSTNSTLIDGTVYLFEYYDGTSTGSGYNTQDYLVTNGSGSVTNRVHTGGLTISTIAPNQGFFVRVKHGQSGSLSFTNAMKSSTSHTFFTPAPDPIQRVYIGVEDEQGNYNRILIAFTNEATEGFDAQFDAEKLQGNPNLSFYSKLGNDKMVIQALPVVKDELSIPIGLFTANGGKFTFKIDTIENMSEDIEVFIFDALENTTTPFEFKTTYKFNCDKGDVDGRFFIVFKNNSTSINKELLNTESEIRTYTSGNNLFINIPEAGFYSYKIFTVNGMHVISGRRYAESVINAGSLPLNGVYIVEIHGKEKLYNSKIIVAE